MEYIIYYFFGMGLVVLLQLTLVLPDVINILSTMARQTDDLVLLDYANNWAMHALGIVVSGIFLWWFQLLSMMFGMKGHTARLAQSLFEVFKSEEEKKK